METPGEIADKLSILKLRETRHPEPAARLEIQRQINLQTAEFRLLQARVRAGLWPLDMLRMPKLKLRARTAQVPAETNLHDLCIALGKTNEIMWENENLRDRLVGTRVSSMSLLEADLREQQLNQDRNAIIDAINEAAIREWAP